MGPCSVSRAATNSTDAILATASRAATFQHVAAELGHIFEVEHHRFGFCGAQQERRAKHHFPQDISYARLTKSGHLAQ